jgi:hypothetical protein
MRSFSASAAYMCLRTGRAKSADIRLARANPKYLFWDGAICCPRRTLGDSVCLVSDYGTIASMSSAAPRGRELGVVRISKVGRVALPGMR